MRRLNVILFCFTDFTFAEQQTDQKTDHQLNHLQWSSSQPSPASSLIYDDENSNDEYSTGYV